MEVVESISEKTLRTGTAQFVGIAWVKCRDVILEDRVLQGCLEWLRGVPRFLVQELKASIKM